MKEAERQREIRNLSVLDWTTSVFGLFWGVWWAFFVDRSLENAPNQSTIFGWPVPTTWLWLMSAILVGLFTYFYVAWMWSARKLGPESKIKDVRPQITRLFLICIAFVVAMKLLSMKMGFLGAQADYGIALTVVWFVLILVQAFGPQE
jgi:hypothetical protein